MRKVAWAIGFLWMWAMAAIGLWLGFGGSFLDGGGILFESSYGDIWILAILAVPGFFLWKWGTQER